MKKGIAALLTPLFLSLAWPGNGSLTFLVFFAFIPMLWLEQQIRNSTSKHKGRQVFLYGWLSFGLFNLGVTWWVVNAHWSGTLAATVLFGAAMSFCFWLFHIASRNIGAGRGLLLLPFFWLPLEYLQVHWDLSFPWLNLGYVFSNRSSWIQWYSYTGVWGGSIWVLWVNAYLFRSLQYPSISKIFRSWMAKSVLAIALPIGVSVWMYMNYEEQGKVVNVIAVQPNIDPYGEKFQMSDEEAIQRFFQEVGPLMSDSIHYVMGPETMIGKGLDERSLSYTQAVGQLSRFCDTYPNVNLVIGASTYTMYKSKETQTARPIRGGEAYFDQYNTSLQISSHSIEKYHKSKLVPGVEMIPFPFLFGPLLNGGIDLGGATGTLGMQEERSVFEHTEDGFLIAAPICWEMEFPEYIAEFVKNGARAIFTVTNDGWWGNTPGKTQHMYYAAVRAIENRRDVVRSANTGITCQINQRGDIFNQLEYNTQGAILAEIHLNEELTVFSEMGDVIGRLSVFIAAAVIMSMIVKRITGR